MFFEFVSELLGYAIDIHSPDAIEHMWGVMEQEVHIMDVLEKNLQ